MENKKTYTHLPLVFQFSTTNDAHVHGFNTSKRQINKTYFNIQDGSVQVGD